MKAIAVLLALFTVTAAAAAVLTDDTQTAGSDATPIVVGFARVEAPRASAPAPAPDAAPGQIRPVAEVSTPRAPRAAPITVPLRYFLSP